MKKLYLLALCCFLAWGCLAQGKKKAKAYNKKANENSLFLEKQWWLGFKAGANLSSPIVVKHYSGISPVNYPVDLGNKKYESFHQLGAQAALEITFTYKQLSLSLQPTYRSAQFIYTNQYEWLGSSGDATEHLILKYEQKQKLEHLLLPLVVKYEIGGNKLRPYVQIGGYTAFLINANQSLTLSGTDFASGGQNNFEDPAITVGAKDLFAKNHWGFIAGAGLNYHLGNVRLNFDVMYNYGMSNISSTKKRYTNNRLSASGDVPDDLKLNNLAFSLGCIFPLRYLGYGFKSIDK
jgi:hypothetical protein